MSKKSGHTTNGELRLRSGSTGQRPKDNDEEMEEEDPIEVQIAVIWKTCRCLSALSKLLLWPPYNLEIALLT